MNELMIFLEIVKSKSLAAAGRSLGISSATVVRKLSTLENQLGVKLIERNTRRLALTEHGRYCYDRCVQIPDIIEEMRDTLSIAKQSLKGELDISIASYGGYHELMPMITKFNKTYPNIKLNIIKTNIFPDLIDDNYDVYFRYDEVQTRSFRSDKLISHQLGLCASQDYLKTNGQPKHPKDLHAHQCLVHQYNKHEGRYWQFQEKGQLFGLNIDASMIINNSAIVIEAVLSGAGIAYLPTYYAKDHPKLVYFMAPYWSMAKDHYITYPRTPHLLAKTKLFVECIKSCYAC